MPIAHHARHHVRPMAKLAHEGTLLARAKFMSQNTHQGCATTALGPAAWLVPLRLQQVLCSDRQRRILAFGRAKMRIGLLASRFARGFKVPYWVSTPISHSRRVRRPRKKKPRRRDSPQRLWTTWRRNKPHHADAQSSTAIPPWPMLDDDVTAAGVRPSTAPRWEGILKHGCTTPRKKSGCNESVDVGRGEFRYRGVNESGRGG